MAAHELRIVVIGAGIGGLVTALSLQEIGARVDVYESVREVGPLGIGLHIDVDGTVADGAGILRVAAIDRQRKDFFGDAEPTRMGAGQKFLGRKDLAARRAVHVGHQALDLTDLVLAQPFLKSRLGHDIQFVVCRRPM